jgi:hypothetical protein
MDHYMFYSRAEHFEAIVRFVIGPFLLLLFFVSWIAVQVRWALERNNLYSYIDYDYLFGVAFVLILIAVMRIIDLRVKLIRIKNTKNTLMMKFLLSLSLTIFSLGFQQWSIASKIDESYFPTIDIEKFEGWNEVKYIKIKQFTPYYNDLQHYSSTLEWRNKGINSGVYIEFLETYFAPLNAERNIWITESFEENLRKSDVNLTADVISFSTRTNDIFTSRDYKDFYYFQVLKPSRQLRELESKVAKDPVPIFIKPVYFSYNEEAKKGMFHLMYIGIPMFLSIVILLFFRVNTEQIERFQQKKMVRNWF